MSPCPRRAPRFVTSPIGHGDGERQRGVNRLSVAVSKSCQNRFTRDLPREHASRSIYFTARKWPFMMVRVGSGSSLSATRAKGAVRIRMQPERRAHRRIKMETPCWLGTETHRTLLACELRDYSVGGAQIRLPFAASLPEQVQLFFTEDRTVGRNSKVIWSDGSVVGLMFV